MRVIILAICLVVFAGPARAELQFRDEALGKFVAAPGIATEIETTVSGVIARTRVIQYFANHTDAWQEGVYTWPLPENAAVDRQVMVIGDRRILGFVAQKDKAREIYESAKREGRATSIVEQHRANMFRTSVANIPPRSLIAIEIGYQHEVGIDNETFSLRLPMASTPRYDRFSPKDFITMATASGPADSAARAVAERLALFDFKGGNNPVTLQVHLDAGFDMAVLRSPSHGIDFKKPKEGRTTVRTSEDIIPGEQDFVLEWSPRETGKPLSFVHSERLGGAYYSHLVIVPPAAADQFAAAEPRPRQVTLIIDVSGSMAGPSLRQAKAALIEALQDLSPQDRFNIISFESETESLFDAPVPAERAHVSEALKWVAGLEAKGGTEMLPAVRRALGEASPEEMLRQIVFMTDGAIGYEGELQRYIAEQVGDARFYAVGIGSAPNALLMKQIAAAGRGTFTFIGDVNETQEKMGALFRKMKAPVLTDLTLGLPHNKKAEIIPAKIPDLMAGEPVMLAVKSAQPLRGAVLQGRRGADSWSQKAGESGTAHEGIGKLYARQKIRMLEFADPLREEKETEAEITALGLQHQIISAYTSMVAVDEKILRPQNEDLVSRRYDPTLPKGWQLARFDPREAAAAYDKMLEDKRAAEKSQNAQIQDMNLPQTAANWMIELFAGVMLMLAGLFIRKGIRCGVQY